jgi:hypothetical protein
MGLRARERIKREHLPRHRAEALLAAAGNISGQPAGSANAGAAWWLTLHQLWEAGRLDMDAGLGRGLSGLPLTEEILAVLLRLRARAGRDEFMRLAVPVAEQGQYEASPEVNLAAEHGRVAEDMRLARLFFLRHERHCAPSAPDPGSTPLSICLAWARELQRFGQVFRPGFVFNPTKHLPASAWNVWCWPARRSREIWMCTGRWPEFSPATADGTPCVSRPCPIFPCASAGTGGWLELGVTNCRAFRVRQGLEELLSARDEALRQGQEARFWRRLEAHDGSGRIRELLLSALAPATHAP